MQVAGGVPDVKYNVYTVSRHDRNIIGFAGLEQSIISLEIRAVESVPEGLHAIF